MKYVLISLLFLGYLTNLSATNLELFCNQFESKEYQEDLSKLGIEAADFKPLCEYQLLGLNIKEQALATCKTAAEYLINHSLNVVKYRPRECYLFSIGCLDNKKFFEEYLYCVKAQAGLDKLGDCSVNPYWPKKGLMIHQTLCLSSQWQNYSNPGLSLEMFCEELQQNSDESQNHYSRDSVLNYGNLVHNRIEFIKTLKLRSTELLEIAISLSSTIEALLTQENKKIYEHLNRPDLPWFLCNETLAYQKLKSKLEQIYLDSSTLYQLKNLQEKYNQELAELELSKQLPKGKYKQLLPHLVIESWP